MKIIFLDVDGVLNMLSTTYRTPAGNNGVTGIEDHLVKRLEFICERTPEVNIVLSSSWRLKDIKTALAEKSFKYLDRILGRTPRSKEHRGEQIQEWLDCYGKHVTSYVILEDEISDICGEKCNIISKENVVEVDMSNGLSDKNTIDAVKHLNKIMHPKYVGLYNNLIDIDSLVYGILYDIGFRPHVVGSKKDILNRYSKLKLNLDTLTMHLIK